MADQKTGALATFVTGAGVPANADAVAAALMASAQQTDSGGGDTLFLSFSGQGANYRGWSLGRDKETPDPETLFIIEPLATVAGWTCWKGGGVAQKHEWLLTEPQNAVAEGDLQDHGPYADGDGWSYMMGIGMIDAETGQSIKFTTTARSAKNVLGDLNREIGQRMMAGEPSIPVVALDSELFEAHGKKNGKPKFIFEGWVTREEVAAYDGDVDGLLEGKYAEAKEEEAPARGRRGRRSAA